MRKYKQYIFRRAEPVQLGNVDPERLMKTCVQAKRSAPGTDAWTPAEFSMLPQNAYFWLAKLLDMVESGKLNPARLVGDKISLEQAPDALMNMDEFQSVGATVITSF